MGAWSLTVRYIGVAVVLLIACAGQPAPTPTPRPQARACPQCPTCPTCQTCECPEPQCPACPAPPAPPPPPEARDWHCFDLRNRKRKILTSYCNVSRDACQRTRRRVRRKRLGKPDACQVQDTAYCARRVAVAHMGRENLCMRTLEDCEAFRKEFFAKRADKLERLSPCHAMRNTDPFESMNPVKPWPESG